MRKKFLVFVFIALVALLTTGILSACEAKDVEVPKPEVIGDENSACEHEYEEVEYVEATCQTRAHTKYVCTLCDDVYVVYSGELAEHKLAQRHRDGDCQSYGYTEHYCTVCKNVIATENDGTFGNHSYVNDGRHVAGNCITLGYTIVRKCSKCGNEELRYDDVYGSHQYGNATYTEATCVTSDYYTSTCKLCGDIKTEYGTDIRDHVFTETVVPGEDCQHTGTIVRSCVNCDHVETEPTAVYGSHRYADAGDGIKHTCNVCGRSENHNETVRDLSDERHLTSCSVCGYVYEDRSGAHVYEDKVSVAANCTTDGYVYRECSICNHLSSYTVPAHHVFELTGANVETVSPTCTNDGYTVYTCKNCSQKTTVRSTARADSTFMGVVPMIEVNRVVTEEFSFGSYPQTRINGVDDPALALALNKKLPALPTAEKKGAWTVFSYAQTSPYAWYIDVTHEEKNYRAVYFTSYRPAVLSSPSGQDNSYVDNNGYAINNVYWFRIDPIVWKPFSTANGKTVLISNQVLDAQALGTSSSAWENSDIRDFLLNSFYNTAFAAEEKAAVCSQPGKVFLLPTSKLATYADKEKVPTDYALCQGAYSLVFDSEKYSPWWLMPEENGWCSELTPLSLSGDLTVEFCDCNVFISLLKNDGKIDELTSHANEAPVETDVVSSFDKIAKLFALFMQDGSEDTLDQLLDETKGLFEKSNRDVSKNIVFDKNDSSIIGITQEYFSKLTSDSHTNTERLTAIARLFGFDGKDVFLEYAGILAQAYQDNEADASVVTNQARLKYNGAVYTKSGSFILPFVFENSLAATVLSFVIVDGEGKMYILVSDLPAVFTATGENRSVSVYGRCMLFENDRTTSSSQYSVCAFGRGRDRALGHDFICDEKTSDNFRSAATCVSFATYYKYCSRCNVLSEKYVEYEGDGLALHTYEYSYTNDIHYYSCSVCGETLLQEAHSFTYEDTGNGLHHVKKCLTCGYSRTEAHDVVINQCALCYSSLPFYSQYWDVSEKGDLSVVAYLNGTELTFRGKGYMKNYSSTLHPPYYENRTEITTVNLSATMYSIGEYAFCDFTALTRAAIPSGIKTIGKYAFSNTVSLADLAFNAVSCGDLTANNNVFCSSGNNMVVTVGRNVERIPAYLFYPSENNLPSISAVYGGDQLTTVGAYAFYQLSTTSYSGPTSAFVTPALKKIGEYAFYNNTLLAQFVLGDDLASVGKYAFYNCSAADFVGDPTLTSVGKYAFYNCYGLHSVTLSGVTTIPAYAFCNTGLRNASLPDTLTSVEEYAFCNCSDMLSFRLPSSLMTIKKYAFCNAGVHSFDASNVETIEEYAFFGCPLTEINAPKLTLLGKFAFSSCKELYNFSAIKLTSLSESTFADCIRLREATYSENLTVIGKECFLRCQKLHHILLPETLTSVGASAFAGCLTLVEIDNRSSFSLRMGATSYGSVALNAKRVYNGKTASSTLGTVDDFITLAVGAEAPLQNYIIDIDFIYDEQLGDFIIVTNRGNVTLPSGYTVLAYSFYNISGIEKITVSSETVERYAFTDCGNLSSVTLESTVSSVAKTAFSGDNITKLTINGDALQQEIDENTAYFTDATILSLFYGESEIMSPATPIDDTIIKQGNLTESISYVYKNELSYDGTHKILTLTGTGEIPEITDSDLFGATNVVVHDGITSIGSYAFSHFASLTDVTLPSGILQIKDHAFYQCYKLMGINLPSSVTTIGNYAFADCYSLEEIVYNCATVTDLAKDNYVFYNCGQNGNGIELTIGNSCEKIPSYLFNPLSSLSSVSPKITSVTIGSALAAVGEFAFRNLTEITDLSFAGTTATIGNGAFSGMTNLQRLTVYSLGDNVLGKLFRPDTATTDNKYVPSSLQEVTVLSCAYIPDRAFMGIPSLQKITLPVGVKSIGERAFASCLSLTSFGFSGGDSETVTPFTDLFSVGERAFADCVSLTSLTLLGYIVIGDYAFSGCSSLSSLSVENVKVLDGDTFVLGKNLFYLCTGMTSLNLTGDYLHLEDSSEEVASETVYSFGVYFVDATECSFVAYAGGKTSYTIANTIAGKPVTTIGEEAFADPDGKSTLVSVTVNALCEEIQASAFRGNASLRRVVFAAPEAPATPKLKFIRSGAFSGCASLSSITLPASVEFIGENAFKNCTLLTSFFIPKSVSTIGTSAFESCRKLQTLTFESNNTSMTTLSDRVFYSCVLLSEITLPKNIATIGASAFEQCTSLGSVALPTELKSIKNNAFSHCKKLNSFDPVSQGISITSLGSNVFNGCTNLRTITLPGTVSSLGAGVFTGCSGLVNLTLPTIGATETDEENGISRVYPFGYYFGTTSYSDSIRIEQNYTKTVTKGSTQTITIERELYYLPKTLKNVVILGGTSFPYGFFMNCSTIRSVDIEGIDVASLPEKAFFGCSSLSSVVLPSSLTAIEGEAFYACSSLTFVDENEAPILSSNVTTIDKSAFYMTGLYSSGSNWQDGVLYVKVKQEDNVAYYAINCSTSAEQSCTLKNGTIRILSYAFENSSFTELYIPSSVRYIGEGILKGNKKITLLSTPFIGRQQNSGDGYLAYFFGVSLKDPEKLADSKKTANSTTSDPGTGTYVPTTLSSLILNGAGDLSSNVCNGCSYLKSLKLVGYETISSYAFANCIALETVSFPSQLRSIDAYAFEDCSHITEIILPETMEQIRVGAFAGCIGLTLYSAPFVGSDRNSTNSFLGYVFSPSFSQTEPEIGDNGNLVPDELSVVVISGNYPIVPEGAFYGCKNITTVVMSSQVTTIKMHAFAGCDHLQTIYFVGSGDIALTTVQDDNTNFNTAFAATSYRVRFEDDAPEASVRPLSAYLENPLYGGESNLYAAFQAFLNQQPYFTNTVSHSNDFFLQPILATSSDETVAAFKYSFRWTETKNGVTETKEVTVGDATKEELLLISTGVTTITILYRINGVIPVTISYVLTVTDLD